MTLRSPMLLQGSAIARPCPDGEPMGGWRTAPTEARRLPCR